MRSSRLAIIVLLVGLVLVSCAKKKEGPPVLPLKVGVRSVEQGDLVKRLYVSGTLVYEANTILSSEVAAQVKSLEVKDGQLVKTGQILLIFDDVKIKALADQAKANLQRDQATLEFNKIEWEKNVELLKSGAISQITYDQKHSIYRHSLQQVDADRAFLTKVNEDLKRTTVRAPIDGLLTDRYIEEGDWAGEGTKLFRISDYSRIRLEPFLTDLDVGKLNQKKIASEGIEAEITVDAYPGRVFKGKLTYIQGVANPNRLFQSRFYLDNPERLLLQGMYARGSTVLDTIKDVTRIPLLALLDETRENEANSCFIVDSDNKAKLTRVEIGSIDAEFAEVTEGLKIGDTIVVEGKDVLTNGQPVQVLTSLEFEQKRRVIKNKSDSPPGPQQPGQQPTKSQ